MRGCFKNIVILGLSIFIGLSGFSQAKNNKKNRYWNAQLAFEKADYLSTIKLLEKNITLDSNNSDYNYLFGAAYFKLKQYKRAEEYLKKGANSSINSFYYLSYISLDKSDLEAAKQHFDLFDSKRKEDKSTIGDKEIQQLKNNIAYAIKNQYDVETVNIINLGNRINTAEDEYIPLITANEELLLFTSRRKADNKNFDPNRAF